LKTKLIVGNNERDEGEVLFHEKNNILY